jgi:hypothetical protein
MDVRTSAVDVADLRNSVGVSPDFGGGAVIADYMKSMLGTTEE